MSKVITINRTPGDFVRDTRHLSVEDRGAYQEILDQIVILGQDADPPSLPNDDRAIANMLGWSVQKWRKTKARLSGGSMPVLIIAGGRLSQVRIAIEIEDARARITGSYIAGKASGESRRAKAEMRERMLNVRSTDVERGGERIANGSRTSHESRVTKEPISSVERRSAKDQIEAFVIDDALRAWTALNAPDVDADAHTERWRDYLRANGYRTRAGPVKSVAASWRNWMANEQKWGKDRHGNRNQPDRGTQRRAAPGDSGSSAGKPAGERNKFHQRTGAEVLAELRAKGKLPPLPEAANEGSDKPVH